MLCAAWELYVKDVLIETVGFLVNRCDLPKQLPVPVQKTISSYVKEDKHELKPLELAGDGWENICKYLAAKNASALNTPKSENIGRLFKSLTGYKKISNSWSCGKDL
jgi:hypothetical protein